MKTRLTDLRTKEYRMLGYGQHEWAVYYWRHGGWWALKSAPDHGVFASFEDAWNYLVTVKYAGNDVLASLHIQLY
jgi:hypothetical protein